MTIFFKGVPVWAQIEAKVKKNSILLRFCLALPKNGLTTEVCNFLFLVVHWMYFQPSKKIHVISYRFFKKQHQIWSKVPCFLLTSAFFASIFWSWNSFHWIDNLEQGGVMQLVSRHYDTYYRGGMYNKFLKNSLYTSVLNAFLVVSNINFKISVNILGSNW